MPFVLRLALKLFVTAMLVAALLTLGFAHRISLPETDPDLLAYLQAGGSLADICDASDDVPHGLNQNCEACRLVDAAACPAPSTTLRRDALVQIRQMRIIAQLRHHAKPLDPAQRTRAPPQA